MIMLTNWMTSLMENSKCEMSVISASDSIFREMHKELNLDNIDIIVIKKTEAGT